jgi:hypothetical protein
MKTNRFIIFCLSVILAVSFSNCSKSYEEPPSLPSENTLNMDFSLMNMQKSVTGIDTSNYNQARKIIMFWDSTAARYNIVPINAFKAASSVSPAITATKLWSWTFNFMVGNSEYLGELNSQTVVLVDSLKKDGTQKDSVNWKLYVAEIGGNFAYIALTGKSSTDNSGGWWKIAFDTSDVTHPYLSIDWKKENGVLKSIKYTNIYATDAENKGSTIMLEKIQTDNYDRQYTTKINKFPKDASLNGKEITIKWLFTTKNGSIFDGDSWKCWDINFKNLSTCNGN